MFYFIKRWLAQRKVEKTIRNGGMSISCPWCDEEAAVYPAEKGPNDRSPIYGALTVPVSGHDCQHCGRMILVYQGVHIIPWLERKEYADGCVSMKWGDNSIDSRHAQHEEFMKDEPIRIFVNSNYGPYLVGTRMNS